MNATLQNPVIKFLVTNSDSMEGRMLLNVLVTSFADDPVTCNPYTKYWAHGITEKNCPKQRGSEDIG